MDCTKPYLAIKDWCTEIRFMKILFIHQNFPGQFKFLAPALVKRGHQVFAMTMQKIEAASWEGVELFAYKANKSSTQHIHPWVADFETKVIRSEACFRAAIQLKESGFQPDIIISHPGWGESLFLKEVWPLAKLAIYCEFYYHPEGADVGFDPEFVDKDPGNLCRLQLKNLNNLMHFVSADAGISPTLWQANTFPEPFRSKITVIHDGIDTQLLAPNSTVQLNLKTSDGQDLVLTKSDEIVTFVNRNLEPYRGYHTFMRALPSLLKQRPQARILIVGGDGVSYGPPPEPEKYGAEKWKEIFIKEVESQIDAEGWSRIHFLGHLPYHHFIPLLQLSTVHVYLTYPFVLSWSLLEAMSTGCAIVASDTAPLKEVIVHNETGRMINFFNPNDLAINIAELLESKEERSRLGNNARNFAIQNYDIQKICLPNQIRWVEGLAIL